MQNWIGDWIGKPLLTRGGERIGYIRSVQTDGALTRVRNLECCDEDEEEFLLPLTAVERFGRDAAVVRALAPPCKEGVSAPFGRAVYSRAGEKLGTVDDLAHEGAKVTALLLSGGMRVPIEQIVGIADTLIVDLEGEGRRVARRPAKKPAARAAQTSTTAAQTEAAAQVPMTAQAERTAAQPTAARTEAQTPTNAARTEAAVQTPTTAARTEPKTATQAASNPAAQDKTAPAAEGPVRIVRHGNAAPTETGGRVGAPPGRLAGSALLTGTTLPDDLKDARGALLAARGTVVDAAVIRRALRHNKLFALTQLCTRGQ